MLRKTLTIFATWLTVLLALAWWGSYGTENRVGGYLTYSHSLTLSFHNGHLTTLYAYAISRPHPTLSKTLNLGPLGVLWVDVRNVASSTWRYVYLAGPIWLLIIPTATYPAVAFLRGPFTRYLRRKRRQCLVCGYSLIGNITGVCPECGKPTTRPEKLPRLLRVTPWHVLTFTVLHLACAVGLAHVAGYIPPGPSERYGVGPPPTQLLLNFLGFMAPAFGALWTYLFVGWLRRRSARAKSE